MKKLNTKNLKNIGTYARLKALCVCFISTVATGLKAIFTKSKKKEEVTQPVDYEKKHWHKYDWEKLNSKDDWN